ncbi:hypothetical protein [Acinetobacter sp. NIPH 298]|uniref:hypothetical protein n=1 Tax=Acinetobacter sp. NIPH 298 TaxID=1217692 RepID=UPI0002D0516F|nr:hypothetical protein [Acinetobacter sp. NIPH 298]ENW95742.1 hypothetical protein F903_01504 [Acinetobacter sp. NIPH 298]
MTKDIEREAFERSYAEINGITGSLTKSAFELLDSKYVNLQTQKSFDLWQAAKAQAVSEIQKSKQSEIDDLKAQLKAVHESRIEFVEYCRKVESGDFVIVDKTDLELAIDALKDAANNDDDSFAHRAKDLEKALKNG